jgi:hypothetical protein
LARWQAIRGDPQKTLLTQSLAWWVPLGSSVVTPTVPPTGVEAERDDRLLLN